jgi:hypothetical protein
LLQQSGERLSSYETDRGLRDVAIQHVGFMRLVTLWDSSFCMHVFCGDSESNEPAEMKTMRVN